MLWTILVMCAVIALDQWTKLLAIHNLRQTATMPVIENILHFTYVENRGAAFGMLADHRWIFMLLSTVAIIAILVWLWREKPKSVWMRLAAAFIAGGGVGNMIDRVVRGYVVDFIDVRCIDFYVFNVADSFVCVGCAMLFLWVAGNEIAENRRKKAASGNAVTVPDAESNGASGTDAAVSDAAVSDAAIQDTEDGQNCGGADV